MTGVGSTIEEIARLSGATVPDISDHLEEAGLLRTDGTATRLAHLIGAASTSRKGDLLWNLERLEVAIREGLDQPPPQGSDAFSEGDCLCLSIDERVLLSSGWTFDVRRDAFEKDLLDRIGRALTPSRPPVSLSWHQDRLTMSSPEGMTIVALATIEEDGLHFHDGAASAEVTDDIDRGLDDDTSSVPDDRKPRLDGPPAIRAEIPASMREEHDPSDRQSAWAEALSRIRRTGTTATAAASAAGLRMNDNTRHALLRGGIPTDHILFAICDFAGVSLSIKRNPKGTPGDPAHYPRLAEAISRRSTMSVVQRDESETTNDMRQMVPTNDRESRILHIAGGRVGSVEVGAALLRILTTASTSDAAIDDLRRRTSRMLEEASEHRHRADAAESRSAELRESVSEIRSVVGLDRGPTDLGSGRNHP